MLAKLKSLFNPSARIKRFHLIEELKKDLEKTGGFLIDSEEESQYLLEAVLPGVKFLGHITEILGYEPDNYHLFGAYEFEGKIFTSFDAGNQWTGYGILDEEDEEDFEFAAEIRAGVKKSSKRKSLFNRRNSIPAPEPEPALSQYPTMSPQAWGDLYKEDPAAYQHQLKQYIQMLSIHSIATPPHTVPQRLLKKVMKRQ